MYLFILYHYVFRCMTVILIFVLSECPRWSSIVGATVPQFFCILHRCTLTFPHVCDIFVSSVLFQFLNMHFSYCTCPVIYLLFICICNMVVEIQALQSLCYIYSTKNKASCILYLVMPLLMLSLIRLSKSNQIITRILT